MGRMRRRAWITTIYAVFAAVVVAAPLSAQEEPVPPAEPPAEAVEPAPAEPVPAEPAPAEPAPAEPAPAEPAPAPAEPAEPAPTLPAPEQAIRDDAPTKKRAAPEATAAASATVTISDFQFAPSSVTVNVGDTVTWRNDGPTAHSATAEDGSFDTGIYNAGQSRSHTFQQAGTFAYICTPHPQMRGTVVVQAAQTGGGEEGGDDTDAGSTSGQTDTTDDGPTLPATGIDAGGLAALGLATLALGAFLRRRSAPSN